MIYSIPNIILSLVIFLNFILDLRYIALRHLNNTVWFTVQIRKIKDKTELYYVDKGEENGSIFWSN